MPRFLALAAVLRRQEMKPRTRAILSCICHALIFLLVFWAFFDYMAQQGLDRGGMEATWHTLPRYFTNDSNLFAALVSVIMIPFEWRAARRGEQHLPRWLELADLIGTGAVTVTFVVVLAFLGPTQDFHELYSGASLPLHLFCPLLSMAGYIWLDGIGPGKRSDALLCVPGVLIYAVVYLVQVVYRGTWPDFYGLDRGALRWVFFAIALAGSYIIGIVLRKSRSRVLLREQEGTKL